MISHWFLVVILKFGKTSNSLKYYQTGSLQKILLLFMFLLTTNFVKNSSIYARILFIFLKTVPDHIRNDFNTKFLVRRSDQEYLRLTLVWM